MEDQLWLLAATWEVNQWMEDTTTRTPVSPCFSEALHFKLINFKKKKAHSRSTGMDVSSQGATQELKTVGVAGTPGSVRQSAAYWCWPCSLRILAHITPPNYVLSSQTANRCLPAHCLLSPRWP